jgi:hypothetical protein
VAVVPRGLLDQVEEHPPQRDRLVPPGQRAPGRGIEVERGHQPAELAAASPVLGQQPGQGDVQPEAHLRVGVILRGRRRVILAEQDDPDPVVLHPAQMADQGGDRGERRAGQRRAAGLLVGKPGALHVHGVADVIQHRGQDGPLVPARRDVVGPGGRGDRRGGGRGADEVVAQDGLGIRDHGILLLGPGNDDLRGQPFVAANLTRSPVTSTRA